MRKKVLKVAILGIVLLSAAWFTVILIQEGKELKEARYSYTGVVTAIVHTKHIDKVWLDDAPRVIKISGTVELVIGERYEIITDGWRNLVSATILESSKEDQ